MGQPSRRRADIIRVAAGTARIEKARRGGLNGTAHKGYRYDTDRLVPPAVTLERVRPLLPAMGITRIANVTGLDVVGVPVVMVCRPNSRGLAVAQGKGLTLDAAKASAVMESIECYHAEHVTLPLVLGSYQELRADRPLVDAFSLPTAAGVGFRGDRTLLWVQGRNLLDGEPIWVPYDVVHTDFTYESRLGRPMFDTTSHGLASGNHPLEATSHALCELIERDATARWSASTVAVRRATRVDTGTVDDPGCREMLDRISAAGLAVMVWDLTSDVGLPVVASVVAEDPRRAVMPLYAASGYGCHPRREIALLRAVSEAVQSRLTFISGSRDDLLRTDYERSRDRQVLDLVWAEVTGGQTPRSFADLPTFTHDSFDEDVALELTRLAAVAGRRLPRRGTPTRCPGHRRRPVPGRTGRVAQRDSLGAERGYSGVRQREHGRAARGRAAPVRHARCWSGLRGLP